MGHPRFFSRLSSGGGGANPLSGDRAKSLRGKPDSKLAIQQWRTVAELIETLGGRVYALQAQKKIPELALPGTMGFIVDRKPRAAVADRCVIMSEPKGPKDLRGAAFVSAARGLGFAIQTLEEPFGGQLDFYRAGAAFVFTPQLPAEGGGGLLSRFTGGSAQQGSSRNLREHLRDELPGGDIVELPIIDPAFACGRHALSPVGAKREAAIVCVDAFHPDAKNLILSSGNRLGLYLIPITRAEAALYAAGTVEFTARDGRRKLLVPQGVSDQLLSRLEGVGVDPIPVDISEWIKRDRGGLESMVLPLGVLRDDSRTASDEIREYRASIRLRTAEPTV